MVAFLYWGGRNPTFYCTIGGFSKGTACRGLIQRGGGIIIVNDRAVCVTMCVFDSTLVDLPILDLKSPRGTAFPFCMNPSVSSTIVNICIICGHVNSIHATLPSHPPPLRLLLFSLGFSNRPFTATVFPSLSQYCFASILSLLKSSPTSVCWRKLQRPEKLHVPTLSLLFWLAPNLLTNNWKIYFTDFRHTSCTLILTIS